MVKNLPANAGDTGSIPRSGRSLGEGSGNPLQYFCLGNPMDREAWQVTVHGTTKSWTRLSRHKINLLSFCCYRAKEDNVCRTRMALEERQLSVSDQ